MQTWRKSLILIAIIGALLFVGIVPVMASDITSDVLATETNGDCSEDTSYNILRGNNLNFGTVKITKLSSNEINVFGRTQCHHECDNVYLEIYLERKVNGTYSTYKHWLFEKENATSVSASIDVIVPSGYYYRVRGYHAAKDGSKESTTTLTDGILVK